MFNFLTKLFSKAPAAAPAPPVPSAAPAAPSGVTAARPLMEVAHLSLSAIVSRFPEELRSLVAQPPSAAATVALPIPTILKQLPTGAVKMSLATLHRQAPAGVFAPLPPGDKRTVQVPLEEVFRHVKPSALPRRAGQVPVQLPGNGFNLFGNAANPYAISPVEEVTLCTEPILEPEPPVRAPGPAFAPAPEAASTPPPDPEIVPARVIAPPPDFFGQTRPAAVAAIAAPAPIAPPAPLVRPSVPKIDLPPLPLPLAALSAAWPEEIKREIAALDGATMLHLPADAVTAGLARGRVSFTWQEIRGFLDPATEAPTSVSLDMPLTLPLKIVAPAFLAASKAPKRENRSPAPAADIPALFSSRQASAPTVPALEIPVFRTDPAPLPPAPAPAAPPAPKQLPQTVGEVFGEAEREHWTPNEIVARTTGLPGVAGAVVVLQEGLLVAQALHDDVKGEVVAAFLPQIFARLSHYTAEMSLGEVDDLLFTTRGAHCQIYRLGIVYFAVFGKPGETLPWHELRIVADALAQQAQAA